MGLDDRLVPAGEAIGLPVAEVDASFVLEQQVDEPLDVAAVGAAGRLGKGEQELHLARLARRGGEAREHAADDRQRRGERGVGQARGGQEVPRIAPVPAQRRLEQRADVVARGPALEAVGRPQRLERHALQQIVDEDPRARAAGEIVVGERRRIVRLVVNLRRRAVAPLGLLDAAVGGERGADPLSPQLRELGLGRDRCRW